MREFSRRSMLRWAWILLAVGGFVAAFATGVGTRGGQALVLPGTVPQSASAVASRVTVTVESATFGGAAVDVLIQVQPGDPGLVVMGVEPVSAELTKIPARSAHIYSDGRISLRFPSEAWPSGVDQTELVIAAVRVREGGGEIRTVAGEWSLLIALPRGSDAEQARLVTALPSVSLRVGEAEVPVETFLTGSSTVVRYVLPEGVLAFAPPVLKAGAGTVEPIVAERQEHIGYNEVWFDAAPENVPLSLVFGDLLMTDPRGGTWTLSAMVNAFEPPPREEGQTDRTLEVEVQSESAQTTLLGVEWVRRLGGDVRLRITVGGVWDPGPAGPPTVIGDGKALRVASVSLFPADGNQSARTTISVALPEEIPPRSLVVLGAGETTVLPSPSVVLRP